MKQVMIAGGGLAGLSLGIALRRRGIPVTITEAGTYPRHRVCGEFITGITEPALARLGIEEALAAALPLRTLAWYSGSERVLEKTLPRKAWGISRWTLDRLLAEDFESLGGDLRTGSRVAPDSAGADGKVWAAGRAPASVGKGTRWIGLKVHLGGLELDRDLELHMGTRGYAGLSRIEDGKLNLCGLFQQDRRVSGKGVDLLGKYLAANGLDLLAGNLVRGEVINDSFSAVAGLEYGLLKPPRKGFVMGDAWTLIPPFTGNGMSMAFESALIAEAPLRKWAEGRCGWEMSVRTYRRQLNINLRGRVLRARLLQGLLLLPLSGKILASLARQGSLPFRTLYSLTH